MPGYSPQMVWRSFPRLTAGQRRAVIQSLLEALCTVNTAYLLLFPGTPWLYDSGIRYVEEPPDRDDWQDIEETLHRHEADCEDLAAWRVAELRVRCREPATFDISVQDIRQQTCTACKAIIFKMPEEDAQRRPPGEVAEHVRRARLKHQHETRCTDPGIPGEIGGIVTTYHIAVRRGDGRKEDPSRRLGMT